MTVSILTDDLFEQEVLNSDIPVLVDFWATWCGPCKAMAPVLDEVAKDLAGRVKVMKLDVDQHPANMQNYGVRAMPTLIIFKGGKPVARHVGALVQKLKLAQWIEASASTAQRRPSKPSANRFKLVNGLDVVVLSDANLSAVAHVIWYKVGTCDAPAEMAGFLQRLAVKSASNSAAEAEAPLIGRPEPNSANASAFFASSAKERLGAVMQLEARRMSQLQITDIDFASERDPEAAQSAIVAQFVAKAPAIEEKYKQAAAEKRLDRRIFAALHSLPAIDAPVRDVLASVSREDILRFHKRYYAPDNALLVVAGDVTPAEVRLLAEAAYGAIPPNRDADVRANIKPAPGELAQRIVLNEPNARTPFIQRSYRVPSYATAKPGEAEAMEILARILGGTKASRLHRRLVEENKTAKGARAFYLSDAMASGVLTIQARPINGIATLEAGIDAVLDEIRTGGVSVADLDSAKEFLRADEILDSDEHMKLARRYGSALVVGLTPAQVEERPATLFAITSSDIQGVAEKYLVPANAVTGWLVPAEQQTSPELKSVV